MIFIFFEFLDISLFAALVFFTAIVTALILGISFHEFSHAYVADTLGDGLPRRMGRVTLNPIAHLEPMGTMLMLIVGFGWGKPVPVNPYNTRNPKVRARRDRRCGAASPTSSSRPSLACRSSSTSSPGHRRSTSQRARASRRERLATGRVPRHLPERDRALQPAPRCLQPDPDRAAGRLQSRRWFPSQRALGIVRAAGALRTDRSALRCSLSCRS